MKFSNYMLLWNNISNKMTCGSAKCYSTAIYTTIMVVLSLQLVRIEAFVLGSKSIMTGVTKRHNADIHTGNAKHKIQPLSGSTDSCISFFILVYHFSCFLFLCHPKGHSVLEIFYDIRIHWHLRF